MRIALGVLVLLASGASRSVRALSSSSSSVGAKAVHKLPRLFIDQSLEQGQIVNLSGEDAHYVGNVMRVKPGFCFRGFNGRSGQGEYLFEIVEGTGNRGAKMGGGEVRAEVKRMLRSFDEEVVKRRRSGNVTLYFAPIKKPKLKLVMEKATEIGLAKFVPVISQNVNVNIDFDKDASFDRIIMESAEQCERMDIPTLVKGPLALSSLIQEWKGSSPLLVCRERSESAEPLLKVLLESDSGLEGRGSGETGLLVGPEGGFTDAEFAEMAKNPAVRFVSLGQNVLRAETAAIAALATVSAAQDFRA